MGYDIAMGKKKKSSGPEWRLYLSMLVVIAVVLGVFFVAMSAFDGRVGADPVAENDPDLQMDDSAGQKGYLLVTDQTDVFLLDLSNLSRKPITWPDDVALLGEPLSQIKGVDGTTGQEAWLNPGFVQASSTVFRSPDGRREARLNTEKRPVGGSVVITYGNSVNTMVLRLRDGRRVVEPQILGWLNKDELALVGKVTSTPAVYTLNLSGDLSRWSYLPSDAMSASLKNGRVYYLREKIIQGQEPESVIGSSLWRAYKDKPHEEVMTDQEHIIDSFMPLEQGLIYATDKQELYIFYQDNLKSAGSGRPLLPIGQDAVLASDDQGLFLLDYDSRRTDLGLNHECSVFFLPKIALDKEFQNQ